MPNKKYLINYANNIYRSSQQLNTETGKRVGGFDKVISYSPSNIDPQFYNQNREILSQVRGNGYWLWKPYFIKKTLAQLEEGDFLVYCDSGSCFIHSIQPIIDLSLEIKQDIIPFSVGLLERHWTKRDAFVLMDCDSPKYIDTPQILTGLMLFRKSTFTVQFVDEFLRYAQDKRIITDMANQMGLPNYPGFKDNRHDQSIFSLLVKKHGLKIFRNPGKPLNDNLSSDYEQLVIFARKKKGYLLYLFSHLLKAPFRFPYKIIIPQLYTSLKNRLKK